VDSLVGRWADHWANPLVDRMVGQVAGMSVDSSVVLMVERRVEAKGLRSVEHWVGKKVLGKEN
jgi:hypothetical protein